MLIFNLMFFTLYEDSIFISVSFLFFFFFFIFLHSFFVSSLRFLFLIWFVFVYFLPFYINFFFLVRTPTLKERHIETLVYFLHSFPLFTMTRVRRIRENETKEEGKRFIDAISRAVSLKIETVHLTYSLAPTSLAHSFTHAFILSFLTHSRVLISTFTLLLTRNEDRLLFHSNTCSPANGILLK